MPVEALELTRSDGRAHDELRPVRITPGVQPYAEGSVMIETGETKVLCAVSVEDRVPPFLRGTGRGWITAEYSMLPRSTLTRTSRETRAGGRTQEIQRLIGRSLRAVVALDRLGERTFTVDCDVLVADGGTRTAAITGAYVALFQAMEATAAGGDSKTPIECAVAATSVGIVGGEALLDLCYEEDSLAEADFNVVMTDRGEYIEMQGTAEGAPFSKGALDDVLALAGTGTRRLFDSQIAAIRELE